MRLKPLASFLCCLCLAASLAGCAKPPSPETYTTTNLQQTNKVERAIVKSVRAVTVNDSSLGTTSGATAGSGGLLRGMIRNLAANEASTSQAFEYILEKPNGDLLTLTQADAQPLSVGSHVLVLYGKKARIILDQTPAPQGEAAPPTKKKAP